jgi:hypothetical protein
MPKEQADILSRRLVLVRDMDIDEDCVINMQAVRTVRCSKHKQTPVQT